MGRPAKSEAQHRLAGTVSHADKTPSAFVGGRPKFPRHLCPEARAEFKRACQLLEERRTLTPGDVTALTVYAEVYSRWVQAKREIGHSLMIEVVVTDNNGIAHSTKRLNPLLRVAENCEARLLALAKSLGLTPVDRERSKQTATNPQTSVIPGSLLDTHPELFPHLKVVPIKRMTEESKDVDG